MEIGYIIHAVVFDDLSCVELPRHNSPCDYSAFAMDFRDDKAALLASRLDQFELARRIPVLRLETESSLTFHRCEKNTSLLPHI